MKNFYYLILLFALILLFEPITNFVILDQHMDFYAPYLSEEEDSFRIIRPPFVGDEKRAEVLLALQELAQKHKLTVALSSHDLSGTLGKKVQGGSSSRLCHRFS